MPETRDPQAVIAVAEQAALAGDYAAAERLLRDAAGLQEASLGPDHPELANTLNNLGVVYEVTEKPDEAERCFRRASAIAAAVLAPDHPFVATSRKNLEDFCAARGIPVDAPAPAKSAEPQTDRAACDRARATRGCYTAHRRPGAGRRSDARRRCHLFSKRTLSRRKLPSRKPPRLLPLLNARLARSSYQDSSRLRSSSP